LVQHLRDSVVGFDHLAPALQRKHLQSKIAEHRLVWLANALQEFAIVVGVEYGRSRAARIDIIERRVGKPQLAGEGYDLAEYLALLLVVDLGAVTGKERPARRDPEDDLAARELCGKSGKIVKSFQGNFEPLGCAPEAAAAVDFAKPGCVTFKYVIQHVAINRKAILDLRTLIGQYRNRGGMRHFAAIGLEKILHLLAFPGHRREWSVGRIQQKNNLDRLLAYGDGLE
jgi:hypothetical protein